jgi:hypothetical protein
MKTLNYLLLGLFSLLSFQSFCQNNEVIIKPSLNILSFRGSGAQSETYSGTPISDPKFPTVFNPYGTSGKIGYGISLAFQRNTKSNFFFGLTGGIERLTSKITSSNGILYDNKNIAKNGTNQLDLDYLNIQPYLGLTALDEITRIEFKIISDLSFLIDSQEEFTFKSDEANFNIDNNREHNELDVRIGLGMAVYVNRFAFNVEYLLGLIDYDDYKADDINIYSQVARFGISYSIIQKK